MLDNWLILVLFININLIEKQITLTRPQLTFRRVMGAIRVSPESCGVGEVLDSFIHSSRVWMKVSQVADSSVVDSSNF